MPWVSLLEKNSWYLRFLAIFIYSDLGVSEVFENNAEANGFQMLDFTFDTSQRTSSIGYIFFEFFSIAFRTCFGQYFIQRVVACKTAKDGKIAFTVGCIASWVEILKTLLI